MSSFLFLAIFAPFSDYRGLIIVIVMPLTARYLALATGIKAIGRTYFGLPSGWKLTTFSGRTVRTQCGQLERRNAEQLAFVQG